MKTDCDLNYKAYFNAQVFQRLFHFCVLIVVSLAGTINALFLVLLKDEISVVFAASSFSFIGILNTYSIWASKALVEVENLMSCS
mmetsp:Transcript_32622/g.5911  ORF Transcript_32622/g.5911 Transcript_32622/m.5911 type:complete len:85 (+) Transcript_32622:2170-2424(+)